MKKALMNVMGLAALGFLLAGCYQKVDKSVFGSGKPEVQAAWTQALAASKANDYVAANTNLVSLLKQDITSDQLLAVQGTLRALNERMNNAAASGDAAAQKAVETLKTLQPQPGRARPGTTR